MELDGGVAETDTAVAEILTVRQNYKDMFPFPIDGNIGRDSGLWSLATHHTKGCVLPKFDHQQMYVNAFSTKLEEYYIKTISDIAIIYSKIILKV